MNNRLCRQVGIDFPLFAFSHCRDVVAAVSKAGGFGVLGASSFTPAQLEEELRWIDAHVQGRPYGVDILVPENLQAASAVPDGELLARGISATHREFIAGLMAKHGIDVAPQDLVKTTVPSVLPEVALQLMDVAFAHPIRLIANALGLAPAWMIDRAHAAGIPVAALVGAKEHAVRQAQAGVDIVVAQGGEAGGHCGEVSTLVLLPEVLRALKPWPEVSVLAAGGIMTGGQMAGCMAMGADGAWTGSVWLATPESETSEAFRERMVAARSRDTLRSKSRTGKPSRQLRSSWHDAWDSPDSPGALPMPLMGMVSQPAFARIEREVLQGNEAARPLVSYYVGQGVGLVESVKSARAVVQEFREEFAEAVGRLTALVGDA